MNIYDRVILKFGQSHQKDKMIEEMAELTQALIKERHGEQHNIDEEIADVQTVLNQMKLLYPDWISWEQVKLKRLEERL
jgi:NTP pyrophosphatase (non-canonical NTP hydrolase)